MTIPRSLPADPDAVHPAAALAPALRAPAPPAWIMKRGPDASFKRERIDGDRAGEVD